VNRIVLKHLQKRWRSVESSVSVESKVTPALAQPCPEGY